MHSIAHNICENEEAVDLDSNFEISEELKLSIHDQCAYQTLVLMETNVRVDKSRRLLKKALNIYCQYITNHKKELELAFELNKDNADGKQRTIELWQEALYKIVINIVKILRMEFENNSQVEVDLVIYFYELLLVRKYFFWNFLI